MYFEIKKVPEVQLTSILFGGGEWRWHLFSAEGAVVAASCGYPTAKECSVAVTALKTNAGSADIRHPGAKARGASPL